MDKNTITGFVLIIAVLVGFSYFNTPNAEQLEAQRCYRDSIVAVQNAQVAELAAELAKAPSHSPSGGELSPPPEQELRGAAELQDAYGAFAGAVVGEEELVTMANDLLELTISTRGGQIRSARLKDFSNYEGAPLLLFDNDESAFNMTFTTAKNRVLNTKDFYFEALQPSAMQTVLRLHAAEGQSLDFIYTIHPDDYLVDFDIQPTNLEAVLSPNAPNVYFKWMQKIRQQEKGRMWEERYSRLTYKFSSDEFDELSDSQDDQIDITTRLKWIGYKNQFFSSVLIAHRDFESAR